MNNVTKILLGLAALLILILFLAFGLLVGDLLSSGADSEEETAAISAATEAPTEAPVQAGEVVNPAELPPPAVNVLPTNTPEPTPIPTETPVPPTETPAPTDTPQPTPTNTSAPVIPPTSPPPTATPVPPTATPVPNTNGLSLAYFGLQDRSVMVVNQQVWFEFTIVNNAGGPVPYGALGVMPKKDGVDRLDWYQHSYGGNNDAIGVNGLQHEDNIRLPEAGNYTLRLVICFEGYNTCRAGAGTWVTLSQEIAVTIN